LIAFYFNQLEATKMLPYYTELETYLKEIETLPDAGAADNSKMIAHLKLFLTFLQTEFKDIISEIQDLRSHREITWMHLWSLWKPGHLYLMPCPVTGQHFVVRLLTAQPGKDFWQMTIEHLDTASSPTTPPTSSGAASKVGIVQEADFGYKTEITNVDRFIGRISTKRLELFPVDDESGWETLKTSLVERGRKWKQLSGVHHLYYEGWGYLKDNRGRVRKNRVCYYIYYTVCDPWMLTLL
jgi:hypothetical protein